MNRAALKSAASRVLNEAWQSDVQYSYPNPTVYPHLWLWDSCFHCIAWAALGDRRASLELRAVFQKQFKNGFVPHMTYRDRSIQRGPRQDVSCFTQPPVYALALACIEDNGLPHDTTLVNDVTLGLLYFLEHRMAEGLTYIVHPWETGCDDSPRWDSWIGSSSWERQVWANFDAKLVDSTEFSQENDAVRNEAFESVSSFFNGVLAHALLLHGRRHDQKHLSTAGLRLGEAIEESLWDGTQNMYVDRPVVGGGASQLIPTLDGILTTLGSRSRTRALLALEQLRDPSRFAAPFGLRFVAADHPTYQPNQYWRGPSWPQLTFLAVQACRRWGADDLAESIAEQARRVIPRAGWSEFWNPETGEGLGAKPQTWAALAVAL